MNDINKTAENIKRIEEFVKYIKKNYNDHKRQAKNSSHIDDIENSLAFLKDYQKITDKLIKDIEEYSKETAGEVIF